MLTNTTIPSITFSGLTDFIILTLAVIAGGVIVALVIDVLMTMFTTNSIKNSATTAINDIVNVTNVSISATQSIASQAITAMLTASGVQDVKHIIEHKMISDTVTRVNQVNNATKQEEQQTQEKK